MPVKIIVPLKSLITLIYKSIYISQNKNDNFLLVNLGILTPATSPNKPQQIFQTTPQQTNYSTPVSTPTTTTYKFENLPMTPISPNIQQQSHQQQKSATKNGAHQQQQQQIATSLAIGSIITSAPVTTVNSVNSNSFELTTTAIQAAAAGVGNQIELISNDCT